MDFQSIVVELSCAIKDNSSRIFVIAPFSNIIDQTAKVLRKAIVLDGEDASVVVDAKLVEKLEHGFPVNWQDLQNNSVQLWMRKIAELNIQPIANFSQDNIFSWTDAYEYNPDFLGIIPDWVDSKSGVF